MDSQDRNDSKLRRREETLARRMGEALDQLKPPGDGGCPDAEVIAAYAEQALGPAESAQWEGHLATCAKCRKILRVLAASAGTPLAEKEVAQLGELASAVRAPVEITGGSAGRTRPRRVEWRMRWLAPALGVAAVLAVWFAMRPPWRTMDRGASTTLVAQAPKEEVALPPAPAEVDQLTRSTPPQDQKTVAAPPPNSSSKNAEPLNSPAEAPAKGRADSGNALDKISPSAGEGKNSLKKQEKELSPQQDERKVRPSAIPQSPPPLPKAQAAMEAPPAPQSGAKSALGTPTPAPLPQARAKANEAAPPAPETPPSARQSVTVTGSAPMVETTNGTLGGAIQQEPSKDLPLNGRDYQALAKLSPGLESFALLKSPSGFTFWRAGKVGKIEHSTNAGRDWVSQKSPSQEDWLAGAAVSGTVCWLVGRHGAIARTVDGERWERIGPPAQASANPGQLPDWTGITARDARTATITASDGRKFATADGGKTWQLQ